MPGRHQMVSLARPRLRWLVATAAAVVAAATSAMVFPAGADAAGSPVKATFGVTGVSTSNCQVSTGGSDVYVKPGQELDIKSSLAGVYVAGHGELSDLVSDIGSLDGSLVIDPKAKKPRTVHISTATQKITGLTSGDHTFIWSLTEVQLLGGLLGKLLPPVPLSLDNGVQAGAKLTYSGTIHVTSKADKCGIAVQVPSASASVHAPGLPPIDVGVPGAKVTVPVNIPKITLPKPGGKTTPPSKAAGTHTSPAPVGGTLPVPALIVPQGSGGGYAGGGYVPDVLPGSVRHIGTGSGLLPVSHGGGGTSTTAPDELNSSGKHKTVDLASTTASTGQLSVVLAIIAVIALSLVSAMYARLYLMRR